MVAFGKAEGSGLAIILAIAAIGVGIVGWASPAQHHSVLFFVSGSLTVSNPAGNINIPVPFALTCTTLYGYVNTQPAGSSLIFNVNKGGVSIGTVTIMAGSSTGSITISANLTVNDVITVNITQVGSTTAGSDLTVEVRC